MNDCTCIVDGYCPKYKRDMRGRAREICKGENISVKKAEVYRKNWSNIMPVRNKLILTCFLSPGDLLAMSAAIYSLHESYPDRYTTNIRTSCDEIFNNNPNIGNVQFHDTDATIVEMHYPSIDRSNQHSTQFIRAYTEYLAERLQIKIESQTNRPMIYFNEEEKNNNIVDTKEYWIVNAGIKNDYTCKQWPIEYYQEVIDKTKSYIQWVQIGETHQNHHRLNNVINLIGKTSFRELMVLALHSNGGIGPVTALMHLMAGVEKPYICINGGREPLPWIQYQLQHTLHTMGLLDCCKTEACWKSRVVDLPIDPMFPFADAKLNVNLCKYPMLDGIEPVAKCMAMIKPQEIASILQRYVCRVADAK